MISSEVQRTLVKSPPELWAELSDSTALARHLGDLGDIGEIRVTLAEPEKRVDWEADGASGSVLIKPSGWGTKVTLSVTREILEVEEPAAEAEPIATEEDEPAADAQPAAAVGEEPTADFQVIAATDEEPQAEAEPVAVAVEAADAPEPLAETQEHSRRGFFARLFGRRKQPPATPYPPTAPADETLATAEAEQIPPMPEAQGAGSAIESLQARFQPEAAPPPHPEQAAQVSRPPAQEDPAPARSTQPEQAASPESADADAPVQTQAEPHMEVQAPAEPNPDVQAPAEPAVDISAELKAAEEVAAEEVTAVLTAVLDRLGAAHHRPFSRA